MNNIRIPIDSTGLGDMLLYTAVCRHIPDATIVLKDSNKKYSFLYKNLCKEIVVNNEEKQLPDIGNDHYIKQKLRYFGIETDDILPKISLDEEKKKFFKQKIIQYKNPIVFMANCSKQWAFYRQFSDEDKAQKIIDKLSENYTVLQFGISSNFTEFKNTIPILDIPLEELPYYYANIGRYCGIDTGDYHLMLATGGKAIVYVPDNISFYNYDFWHYKMYTNVVKYINFKSI